MNILQLPMLLFLIFLFSCSSTEVKEKKISKQNRIKKIEPTPVLKKVKEKVFRYQVKNLKIRPGEVVKLDLNNPSISDKGKIQCKDKEIPFIKVNDIVTFYVSESYFSNLLPFTCDYFFDNDQKVELAKFKVEIKKFPFEKLNVNKKKVFYSKRDLKRIIKEKKELDIIYSNGSREPFFNESFKIPLRSKVTSIYGTRRIFNNNKKSQHLGTDYRARIGHPIRSSNSGMVVLSKNLFFSGNTVILDHGMGVFTLYGHLSKSIAKVGQLIGKNELLGAAGMTGRVTGPHLHWGVKVHGQWVDGDSLVDQI